MSFGPQGVSIVVVIDFAWSDLKQSLLDLLGQSTVAGGAITRKLPHRHPTFPWAVCRRVGNVEGVGWKGKEPKVRAGGATSEYHIARVTASYENVPWRMLEDNQTLREWDRWVIYNQQTSVEYLTREKAGMVWIEGPQSIAGGNARNEPFIGPQGQLLPKTALQWQWMEVPFQAVFNSDNRPANIDAGVGKVNSVEFAGYSAETLLLESAAITFTPRPLDLSDPEDWVKGRPAVYCNVTFNMKRFNPPHGGATLGWNLDPDPVRLNWYKTAFSSDLTRGKFETYPFATLFTPVG